MELLVETGNHFLFSRLMFAILNYVHGGRRGYMIADAKGDQECRILRAGVTGAFELPALSAGYQSPLQAQYVF